MLNEKSAGVIIFLDDKTEKKFLLLKYPSGHWDFVKGRVEEDETYIQTATRETKEEVDINDLNFVDGFEETIRYNFQHEGLPVYKQVIFFLAETKTRKIKLSHEHVDYIWMNLDEAINKITFSNARRILKSANSYLSKNRK